MEKTVKQRLIEYLKFKKIGQTKFEEMAGLSRGYITNLRKEPTTSKLLIILSAAPDLNRTWLETGEGEMLNTPAAHRQESNVVQVPLEYEKITYTTTGKGVKYMMREDGQMLLMAPLVPVSVLASMGDEDAPDIRTDGEEWPLVDFEVKEVYHGNYIAFKVRGDSMDNGTRRSFEDGDILLCRELDRDDWMPRLHIDRWRFWVVCWGNNVRLKEIVRQDTETGTITLHSLNTSPEYTDFTLRLDDIHHLYNVVKKKPKDQDF